MKKLKTVKISEEIHKELKVYCAMNSVKVIDFVESLIKKEISNDNNKDSQNNSQ